MKRQNVFKHQRCHWHWFQTNWTRHFSPCYFYGIKIGFEETVLKLPDNFGNRNSQDSHKNQYPNPILNFITEPQYSDKCWLNFPLKCHIFTIGNTQYYQQDHPIHALVSLFGTSYHMSVSHQQMMSSLYHPQQSNDPVRLFCRSMENRKKDVFLFVCFCFVLFYFHFYFYYYLFDFFIGVNLYVWMFRTCSYAILWMSCSKYGKGTN